MERKLRQLYLNNNKKKGKEKKGNLSKSIDNNKRLKSKKKKSSQQKNSSEYDYFRLTTEQLRREIRTQVVIKVIGIHSWQSGRPPHLVNPPSRGKDHALE